jgi:hypothetical protein
VNSIGLNRMAPFCFRIRNRTVPVMVRTDAEMIPRPAERIRALIAIKLLHTAVWTFFVICIVLIPVAAASRRLFWAEVLAGLVFAECGVLAVNHGRCPLTDLACR